MDPLAALDVGARLIHNAPPRQETEPRRMHSRANWTVTHLFVSIGDCCCSERIRAASKREISAKEHPR